MRKDVDLVFDLQAAVISALRGNVLLVLAVGDNPRAIRQFDSHQEELVPSIGIDIEDSEPEETNVRCVIGFHWLATSLQQAREIRKLTLEALHSDYTKSLGGLKYFSQPFGVEVNPEPREGVTYISEDVEFNPYRFYTDE